MYIIFLGGHKIYYHEAKKSHEQFMIMHFNTLAFVISLSNFNIFLFEQYLDASISHNISRKSIRIA